MGFPMQKRFNTRYLVQLALLIALEIIFASTPLGYIPLGFMDITIMHIPVLVGAVALGPAAGGILGTVFGLTSLAVATMRPTIGTWPFNVAVTGSFSSIVIAMVPRILLGILAAYVYKGLTRWTGFSQRISAGIAAAVGSICNTVLVLGGMYVLLGERYAAEMGMAKTGLLAMIGTIITTNGVTEAIAAVLVCVALVKPLRRITAGKLR